MENQFFLNTGFEVQPSSISTWQSLSSAMEIQPTTLVNCDNQTQQQQGCFFTPTTWDDNNNSCYNTPLNSPPKQNTTHQLVKENLQTLNTNMSQFSADPGFVERAAKFSCFGSKSFNDRRSQLVINNNAELVQRSVTVIENGKLSRVSSTPSLKTFGSQMGFKENKNSSQLQEIERIEVANSQEESTISEQNTPIGEICVKNSTFRKRKGSSFKGKASNSSNPNKVKLQFF